jgi:hypothetical protein
VFWEKLLTIPCDRNRRCFLPSSTSLVMLANRDCYLNRPLVLQLVDSFVSLSMYTAPPKRDRPWPIESIMSFEKLDFMMDGSSFDDPDWIEV